MKFDPGVGVRLVAIAAIFLLSFVTFNILFKASQSDGYFQEIIAALIGTILAAVVTTLLLKSQSQGEEIKERNVAVFTRKLGAYEAFLDTALGHLQDSAVSNEEAHDLRRLVYKMALFSSETTIDAVSRYVRCMYVRDQDGDLNEVISAFRTELALENVDEISTLELSAVDTLLKGRGARANVEFTKETLIEFGRALEREILKLDEGVTRGAPDQFQTTFAYGDGNSLSVSLASGAIFNAHMSYMEEADTLSLIEAWVEADDLPPKMRDVVYDSAVAAGLEIDPDDPEDVYPSATVAPTDEAESVEADSGEKIWSVAEVAKALVEIERRANEFVKIGDS